MIVRTGLGAVNPTAQQAIGAGYSIGTAGATPAVAGAAVTAGLLPAALAVPIVGAAFAGIFLGIEALLNSGCGQSCVVTSRWANQAEALLQQNLAAYLALPVPRAQSAQAAYLANANKLINALFQACSNTGTTAGNNCVNDRETGACHYHTSPGGWSGSTYIAPGQNGSGNTCWNWEVGYADPIAHDPNVVSDAAASVSSIGSTFAGTVSAAGMPAGMSPYLVAGALLLVIGLGVAAS